MTIIFAAIKANASENYVINGTFENDDMKPWIWSVAGEAEATGSIVKVEKHSGSQSLLITNASAFMPQVYGSLRQRVEGLKPNTKYRVSLWIKGEQVSKCFVATGEKWDNRLQLPPGTYDWQEINLECTTGDRTWENLIILTAGVTNSLWIDDIEVTEASQPIGKLKVFPSTVTGEISQSTAFYPIYALQQPQEAPVLRLASPDAPLLQAFLRMSWNDARFFFLLMSSTVDATLC